VRTEFSLAEKLQDNDGVGFFRIGPSETLFVVTRSEIKSKVRQIRGLPVEEGSIQFEDPDLTQGLRSSGQPPTPPKDLRGSKRKLKLLIQGFKGVPRLMMMSVLGPLNVLMKQPFVFGSGVRHILSGVFGVLREELSVYRVYRELKRDSVKVPEGSPDVFDIESLELPTCSEGCDWAVFGESDVIASVGNLTPFFT
jgi:hypothetical protein